MYAKLAGNVKNQVRCPSDISAPVVKEFVGASTIIRIAATERQHRYLVTEESLARDRLDRGAAARADSVYLNPTVPAFFIDALAYCRRLFSPYPGQTREKSHASAPSECPGNLAFRQAKIL